MKHLFKRALALVCMLAMLISVLPMALTTSAAEIGEFTILSTTDMHGRCYDKNLLNDTNTNNSMLNVATAVAAIRAEKDNVILFDNGDTYQGTPVSSYQLSLQKQGLTDLPNPMALSMKEIGYDYAIIGNHEFNYDWQTMEEVRDYLADGTQGSVVETLCANLYYDGSDGVHAAGENVFKPYDIREITVGEQTIKLGIIGFENTDCPRWDVPDNYPGIVFTHPDNTYGAIAWEAERYVKMVQDEGADFVIVSYHSGLGDGADPEDIVFGQNSEGQILSMLHNTSGIDMVIAGHDHSTGYSGKTYKDKDGKDVLVVNGAGSNLTSTTFAVAEDGTVSVKENKNLSLSNYAADADLKAKMAPYVELASEYVNQECGVILNGDWSKSTKFYLEQTDSMDLINRAQISRGSVYMAEKYDTEEEIAALYEKTGLDHLTVDASATSVVVSGSYTVQPGTMNMKKIYQLYKYDNTLYLIPMTGAQIKEALEFNASTHFSVNTASGTPVYNTIGDDFTNPVFYGLDFRYDMSMEKGSRITGLKFADGREVEMDKTYIMAVNNYHLGNASGPFADYTTTDAVWSQTDDLGGGVVQDLIAEFIANETEKNGGVAPAPSDWALTYSKDIVEGEVSGKYIARIVTDPGTLKTGDTIFIYHNGSNQLVTAAASGSRLAPSADVTVNATRLGTSEDVAMFTVVKGDDGYYRFCDADGKFMTSGATGNSLSMTTEESEYSLWAFKATTGGFNIHAVNAAYSGNKNQYLEYYSGFTTYGLQSNSAYLFNIYLYTAESGDCVHENTEVRNAVEATCLEDGYTGDTYCLDCGEKLADGEAIAATGHVNTEVRDAVEATCLEDGYTGDTYCLDCGEKIADGEAIAATGHVNTEVRNAVDATCLEDGYTGDTYCLDCGEKLADGEVIAALGHLWGEWEVLEEPTHSEAGKRVHACERCGVKNYDAIPALGCPSAIFTDVPARIWFHDAVDYMVKNELMNGVGDGLFNPNGTLTRAQLVTILYRVAGSPEVTGETAFEDVKPGLWYSDAILWAEQNGVVNGTTETTFSPDKEISREQIATILYRWAKAEAVEEDFLKDYPDADKIRPWAVDAMNWAVSEGLITGSDGQLVPLNNATRAQIAAILMRYLTK